MRNKKTACFSSKREQNKIRNFNFRNIDVKVKNVKMKKNSKV